MATGHRAATRSVLEGHEHAGILTQIEMSGRGMDANTVLALGLGVTPPWRLGNQRLETGKQPHELHLEVAADRGSLFPCPVCGKPCKAHDFAEFTWRHLNFFQHHCYITAKIPRTDCGEHGVLRITAPWAREGSRFTLLFEQAALMLVREMPVLAAARIIEITDKRLWRIVEHYVGRAVERLDLRKLAAVGLDETAAKRGHTYVTVFIDLDRREKPVVFVTPGRGKETVVKFRAFLAEHGGSPGRIAEVVCDMSGAFIAAVGESFENAAVTVDCWGGRPHGIEGQTWVVTNQDRSRPCPRLPALVLIRPRLSSPCTASTKVVRRSCEPIFAARRWFPSSRSFLRPRLPWKRAAVPTTGLGNSALSVTTFA